MEPARIADDLDDHDWYVELVAGAIADVEAFLGRWAAFQEAVADVVLDEG